MQPPTAGAVPLPFLVTVNPKPVDAPAAGEPFQPGPVTLAVRPAPGRLPPLPGHPDGRTEEPVLPGPAPASTTGSPPRGP
ncbi:MULTISPECIES: hypothetical protein [unclassified Streptomyces]|uniref:hypothetical protein n=1 Tax=unclassified Streptomyces TaxID=2593676 RepID=UPI003327C25F